MSFKDIFVTDPLLKRIRKMEEIQNKLKEGNSKRLSLGRELEELTKEYEKLRFEAKSLKKTGKLPDEKVA